MAGFLLALLVSVLSTGTVEDTRRYLAKLRRAQNLQAEIRSKKLYKRFGPYKDDPKGFVNNVLKEHLWSKQVEIAESVRDNRRTAVKSCHDSGKSFTAARIAAWWLSVHPPGSAFVVTTAPTGAQVKAILWREIGRAHRKGKLPGRVNLTEWYMPGEDGGEEMVAFGRKPSEHDPASFTGIHARYVLVLIDEASGVPKALWDAADTLITNEDSRILAIGNPDDPNSEFGRNCRPGSGWNVITIRAQDTPNFTGEEVPEAVRKVLLSGMWVREKLKQWGKDSPLYISKVNAEFPIAGEDAVFHLHWIERARERELMARGEVELAVDVARKGTGETVVYGRQGMRAWLVDYWTKKDTMTTARRIASTADETGALTIKVDAIGIGAGVVDKLEEIRVDEGKPWTVIPLDAGGQAADPKNYLNNRAQWYWGLREIFEEGEIDLDPIDEEVVVQLVEIKHVPNARNRIQIESKDDMRARGVASPDRADALMMAFANVAGTDSRQAVIQKARMS